MIIVISPAKTLDYETPPTTAAFSMPDFLDAAQTLIDELRELTPPQVSELMGISAKLGDLNFGRYLEWSQPFTPSNAKQAVLAFKGDVYTGLEAETLSRKELEWAQDHLRILSGLYGLLRPLDLMQPYRLEMGTQFANSRGRNLYEFWGEQITSALNALLANDKKATLINLASNEYFKAVQVKKLQAEVITPVFKDWKSGKYKIVSFYAKKARGMMAGYIIRHRLKNPEDLKQFDDGGYRYNPAMSSYNEWVFTRDSSN
ncbi:MAG: peroxide stress protein YaaA [Porticoccaceae bacterium]|nr:peroxide stress protein YaaA [Porticoccaceae bacterium]